MVELEFLGNNIHHPLINTENIVNDDVSVCSQSSDSNEIVSDLTKNKKFNYLKSNSLGMLSVVDYHEHFGPAILHWEGGIQGGKMIQKVKPMLSRISDNIDWKTCTLNKLNKKMCIDELLSKKNVIY